VYKLLTYDPEQRITAEEALKHPCFHGLEKIYRARHSQHVRGKSQILPPIGHVMAGKNFSLSKNPREPVLNLSAVYPKKSFKVS
jgi:serine/threonine protein kinase